MLNLRSEQLSLCDRNFAAALQHGMSLYTPATGIKEVAADPSRRIRMALELR